MGNLKKLITEGEQIKWTQESMKQFLSDTNIDGHLIFVKENQYELEDGYYGKLYIRIYGTDLIIDFLDADETNPLMENVMIDLSSLQANSEWGYRYDYKKLADGTSVEFYLYDEKQDVEEGLIKEHKGFSNDIILKQPKHKRNYFIIANKFVELLKQIRKPYFTESSFKYWWDRLGMKERDWESVHYLLADEGIIQPDSKKEITEGTYDEALKGLNDNQQVRVRGLVNNVIEKVRREYRTMKDAEVEATNALLGKFFKGEMW